jgi:antitoxin HigA-1
LIHPGEILALDFLEPMALTADKLSQSIGVQQTRISQIIAGKRGITADTALRLAHYFGNSAQFWMNLQVQYDLRLAQAKYADVYAQIESVLAIAS